MINLTVRSTYKSETWHLGRIINIHFIKSSLDPDSITSCKSDQKGTTRLLTVIQKIPRISFRLFLVWLGLLPEPEPENTNNTTHELESEAEAVAAMNPSNEAKHDDESALADFLSSLMDYTPTVIFLSFFFFFPPSFRTRTLLFLWFDIRLLWVV